MPKKRVQQGGGIIVYGEFVVLRRNKAGKWIFPKGHVDLGETTAQTALREAEEETGLLVEVVEAAGSAKFNAWSSSISQGGFVTVAPGATDATTVISVNSAESNLTPALGVMVVTFDNKSGADEAQLIRVK